MATLAGYLFQIHGNIEIGTDHSGRFFYPYISERNQKTTDKQIYLHIAMQNILPLPSSDGIRKTKKALRMLIPVGLETGIGVLGLEGMISPMQSIIANA